MIIDQSMSCYEKPSPTCHAERSEVSGLTNRTAWHTSDSSLPLRMTCQGTILIACYDKHVRRSSGARAQASCALAPLPPNRRPGCFAPAQHDTSRDVCNVMP